MTDLDIATYLPEIELIGDTELRAATIRVWQQLWRESSFDDVMGVPVTPATDHKHIPHNRSVAQMALAVADVLEKVHGVHVDRDKLLTAALLQDASKLVEYEPTADGVARSDLGRRFQHAFYAAHVALNEGLPRDVVEAVISHTHDNPSYPATLIAKILFYVDQIDTAALEVDRWKKTSVVHR
jgi:predicted hydrolase (HD superfamily)